jgi:hypothetical protein
MHGTFAQDPLALDHHLKLVHGVEMRRDNRMRELFHKRRQRCLWRRSRRREYLGHPDGLAIRQDTRCRKRLDQDHASPFLRLCGQRAPSLTSALPFSPTL